DLLVLKVSSPHPHNAIAVRIGLVGNRSARHAKLQCVGVPEPGPRIVSAMIPAPPTPSRGADEEWPAGNGIVAADQPARLRIDALGKIVVLDQRPDIVDLAVIAIDDKDKAALVQVNEQVLAVSIEEQRFVGGVVVPQIVLDFLAVPLELPGLAVERKY